jgi:large subunit ribosomal protein L32
MPHEPKRRHSKAAKRTRRASIILKSIALEICKNCNANTLAHMACRGCGFYAGKKANDVTKVTRA